MSKKLLGILFLVIFLGVGCYFMVMDNENQKDYEVNHENVMAYIDMEEDSRERYITFYGIRNNRTYEESEILIETLEKGIIYEEDEEVKYKSINVDAGSIDMGNNESDNIGFKSEIKYIVNKNDGKFKRIENIGEGEFFVDGKHQAKFEGGGLNVNVEGDFLRISETGAVSFEDTKGLKVGGDIEKAFLGKGRSKIKTFVAKIALYEL